MNGGTKASKGCRFVIILGRGIIENYWGNQGQELVKFCDNTEGEIGGRSVTAPRRGTSEVL